MISLKKDNIPTRAGYYLVKRPDRFSGNGKIELAKIILSPKDHSGRYIYGCELYLFCGSISAFPLKKIEHNSLWSDEIKISIDEDLG